MIDLKQPYDLTDRLPHLPAVASPQAMQAGSHTPILPHIGLWLLSLVVALTWAGSAVAQDDVADIDEPTFNLRLPLGSPLQRNTSNPARDGGKTAQPPVSKPKLLSEYDDMPGLQKKINFKTPNKMEVVQFIRTMTQFETGGDLNVVISVKVTGAVQVDLKDVTVADALEMALAMNSLAYEVRGEGARAIITIMTDEEYRALNGVGFYELREVRIVQLDYAKASRIFQILEGIKSDQGKLIFDDLSGTLVLIDTPVKLVEMEAIIATAEIPTIERKVPTVTRTFRLKYVTTADVEKEIAEILTKQDNRQIGSMIVNSGAKAIIVTDLPQTVEKIAGMIRAFDRRPQQVAIQAKVVQVRLSDAFSLGVNWQHVLEKADPRFKLTADSPLSAGVGPTLSFKTVTGGGDLTLLVDALKTMGDTKIISNPHVSVLDGEEATIKVITRQPYREIAYESGSTNVIGVSYKWEEVGAILSVTPRINDDNYITVDIKPQISSIESWYDYPSKEQEGVLGIPVVKTAEAATTVVVKDGVTIIIGGMIESSTEFDESSVPVLGAIPLLGQLFRSTTEKKVKMETIVFLTPTIIAADELFLEMPEVGKEPKFRLGEPGDDFRRPDIGIEGDIVQVQVARPPRVYDEPELVEPEVEEPMMVREPEEELIPVREPEPVEDEVPLAELVDRSLERDEPQPEAEEPDFEKSLRDILESP